MTSTGGGPRRLARTFGLRSLLLLVVLVPTAGMVVLGTVHAADVFAERDAARTMRAEVAELVAIADARVRVADEQVVSSLHVAASEVGLGADELGTLLGTDLTGQLVTARAAVDRDPHLSEDPTLAASLGAVRNLRAGIDDATLRFEQLQTTFGALIQDLDRAWEDRFRSHTAESVGDRVPATIHARLDALGETHEALSAGLDRSLLAGRFLVGALTDEAVGDFQASTTRFEVAVEAFGRHLGPAATAAWRAAVDDPAFGRFEALLDAVERSARTGMALGTPTEAGPIRSMSADGAAWAGHLAATTRSAAVDLDEQASALARDAERELRVLQAAMAVILLATVVGAGALARAATRPMVRLEGAARSVRAGQFDLTPLAEQGPRELADAAAAFNDMAATLRDVEAYTLALAEDPDAPLEREALPGRTGQALRLALDRLRQAVHQAELQRQELRKAATHDPLTGLLTRDVATEAMGRDLPRVVREGGALMVLFVDLDGLKDINDSYGHAAGDRALQLTADALRASIRVSDVAARIGGDEFLVAGVVHDPAIEGTDVASRVHAAISDQRLTDPAGEVPLRCSIGAAFSDATDTVETVLHKADTALYEAKRHGRNQVAWHRDRPSQPSP